MNVFMLANALMGTILYLTGAVLKSDTGLYLRNIGFGYIMGIVVAMIIKLGPLLV